MDARGSDRPHAGTQMRPVEKAFVSLFFALILSMATFQTLVQAHAFPVRSDPRVGWTIPVSPPKVTIWFDGELEPAFSTITVYNSAKQRVDKGNGHVSPADATVMQVDLPALPPGTYRVYWSVIAKDTHRTEGDFPFTVEKKQS